MDQKYGHTLDHEKKVINIEKIGLDPYQSLSPLFILG